MRAFLVSLGIALAAPAVTAQTAPQEPAGVKRAPHPAIAARRVIEQRGYDYASNFYPHPAWLYLSAESPHPMSHHPAVLVFKRQEEERRATLEEARRMLAGR